MSKNKKTIFVIVIGLFSFSLLFLNLYKNFFGIIPDIWFDDWRAPADSSEQLIINSLQEARQYGIGYNYGLMGGYVKQIGLQGILLRIIDLAFHAQELPVTVFKGIFVFIFCVFILYFIYWSWTEFGIGAAIALYFGTFFNRWIIASSHNLYWASFTFLLPFLWMLLLERKEEQAIEKYPLKKYFIVSFLSIFIRASCGFEMISTVMISVEVPIFYYALKNKWDKKKFCKKFFLIAVGACSAFITAIFINFIQQTFYFSSISKAVENIIYTVSKRTGAFNVSVAPIFQDSLEASKLSVLFRYFTDGQALIFGWHMDIIFLIFVAATICCFINNRYSVTIAQNRRKLLALGMALWISFLGAPSWYILASPHSYIHTTINCILWSYPFLLLGCILCGSIISALIFDWQKSIKRWSKVIIPFFALVIVYFYMDYCKVGEKYLKIVPREGIPITSSSYADVYYYNGSMYYLIPSQYKKIPLFLHLYADDSSGSYVNAYGFVNNDFNFEEYELKTYVWRNTKIARVSLNKEYEIGMISTGQYDGSGRIWEFQFDFLDVITPPSILTPYDMSDNNWTNGISKDGTRILTDAYDISYMYLKGRLLKTASGEKIRILNIEKQNNWFHFILDKAINPSDGYPNYFEVIDE